MTTVGPSFTRPPKNVFLTSKMRNRLGWAGFHMEIIQRASKLKVFVLKASIKTDLSGVKCKAATNQEQTLKPLHTSLNLKLL